MTRTWRSRLTITLSVLKSRWTRPLSCAAASPRPASMNTCRISCQAALLHLQPVRDGVPLHVLHRDEDLVFERADVVRDDDVRVRQARDRLRLAQRALPPLRQRDAVARLHAQQLDRDLAIQLRVVRRVDLAHAAAPDHRQHDVAADARPARERGRHRIGQRLTGAHLRFPKHRDSRISRGAQRHVPGRIIHTSARGIQVAAAPRIHLRGYSRSKRERDSQTRSIDSTKTRRAQPAARSPHRDHEMPRQRPPWQRAGGPDTTAAIDQPTYDLNIFVFLKY